MEDFFRYLLGCLLGVPFSLPTKILSNLHYPDLPNLLGFVFTSQDTGNIQLGQLASPLLSIQHAGEPTQSPVHTTQHL